MRHKNLIRMLALGLSAALLLSGCGGENGGEKNPSPSPSETETESESVPPEDAPKDYSKFNAYLDQSKLASLFGAFNTAYEDLIAAMGKEEEQGKVFTGATAEAAMKLYTNKVNALYVSVGSLAQALNEGSDYVDAYNSVIDAYSGMVSGYNSII